VKTEVLSMKLPLHEATLVRRQAVAHGLSKSSYGANLVMRGLEAESADRLPALIDQLNQIIGQFDQLVQRVNRLEGLMPLTRSRQTVMNSARS
jgi:hypothetical protein